jgi:16S rRNA (uracil1498-N3)-methyltransferase
MNAPTKTHRFFVASLPGEAGATVHLPLDEAHHALHVLRLVVGANVEVFDGCGAVASARIVGARRDDVALEIFGLTKVVRPDPIVHVGFAVPKGKRVDWLLEKATELGAASLAPVVFARSVAGGDELSPGKRQRWLGHCISAAKQCGLNFLPEMIEPMNIEQFIKAHADDLRLLGDPAAQAPLAATLGNRSRGQALCILIGPEGSLTDQEQSMAVEAGFAAARLGQTILRTETAVIALLAAVVAMCEERL